MSDIINSFSPEHFHFENSQYLYLLIFVLAFIIFEFYPGRRFNFSINKLKEFIDEPLIPHLLQGSENKSKNVIKAVYVFVICILLILALANPRWNFEEVDSYKANINIIFAVDLSKSMDAEDLKPSRLERVKQEINDILDKVGATNFAILGFAEQAHIISPLTDDKESIKHFTSSLSTDLISIQGSNIQAAIEQANFMFKPVAGGINYLIIMSDGDFNTQQNMANFRLKLKDAKLITYGFGTLEGAPIKQKDGSFIKFEDKIVISKYNIDNLKNLAGKDNYVKASYLDNDVEYISSKISKKTEAEVAKYQTMQIWQDRFYIPLIIATIMLIPFFRKGSIFPIIALFLLFPSIANAEEKVEKDSLDFLKWENIKENILSTNIFRNEDQRAVIDFENRDYESSIEKFSSPYNKGVSAYRDKDFQNAEKFFLSEVKKDNANLKSLYNLGNSQLMQLKAEEAIKSYEQVLSKDKNHMDAKHNLEIAKKLLKKQNKDQKKQDNQDKKQNNQDKEEDKDQKNKNGNQGNDKSDQQGSDSKEKDGKNKKGSEQEANSQKNKQQGKSSDKQKSEGANEQKEGSNTGDNNGGEEPLKLENLGKDSGNGKKFELDNKANKIFDKLSSDTGKFMKNRFRYEESKDSKIRAGKGQIKPW